MNIIGCDLHTRYQVVAWVGETTGEILKRRLGADSSAPPQDGTSIYATYLLPSQRKN